MNIGQTILRMSVRIEELEALGQQIGEASRQQLLVVTSQLHQRVPISRRTSLNKLLSHRHEDLLLRRPMSSRIHQDRTPDLIRFGNSESELIHTKPVKARHMQHMGERS
jgi:hypothetical protein